MCSGRKALPPLRLDMPACHVPQMGVMSALFPGVGRREGRGREENVCHVSPSPLSPLHPSLPPPRHSRRHEVVVSKMEAGIFQVPAMPCQWEEDGTSECLPTERRNTQYRQGGMGGEGKNNTMPKSAHVCRSWSDGGLPCFVLSGGGGKGARGLPAPGSRNRNPENNNTSRNGMNNTKEEMRSHKCKRIPSQSLFPSKAKCQVPTKD